MTKTTPAADSAFDNPDSDIELANPLDRRVPPRAVRMLAREAGILLPLDHDSENWSLQQ